ncbi:MAG: heavy metal translocating P-type ATPase [Agathobacter sp.]|nr:heavy metal translocating P-type ATPase [Agathobacter sp.]
MNKKQKKMLTRIIIAAVLMIVLAFLPVEGWLRFALYMVPYLTVGYDILRKAFKGICNKQVFDENFLMAIATIGAILIAITGDGDYTEAVAVMLFYQIGELFQSYAVGKSRKNISELMDIRPDYANVEVDGQLEQVDPDEVAIGSYIIVQPGEKVPIDGIVVEGHSTLNTVALTGESIPRDIDEGDEITSGCINMTGVIKIQTTKEFGESTVSKILDLVENASSRKSRSEDFIAKFAKYYTPIVCYSALALAILPPLFRMLAMGLSPEWGDWVYRALTFLVISCPCALVISIPLSFFAGIGGASNAGVLIKGSNYLETLSQVNTVVFDKTGTLTKGVFEVVGVHLVSGASNAFGEEDGEQHKILELAAHAESASSHPIAKSIQSAYLSRLEEKMNNASDTMVDSYREIDRTRVTDIREVSGKGVVATVDGKEVVAGNYRLMNELGITYEECDEVGTIVHMAVDGAYVGHILISDVVKDTSKQAMAELKKAGVKNLVMLTGDVDQVAKKVAKELGIDKVFSQLMPGDKVAKVEELLGVENAVEDGALDVQNSISTKKKYGKLAFAGDGINDAPVLSRADIGIAMGAMGSDAAIEAADVVLMDDDPLKIAKAIKISRKCMRIVYQNVIFALGVKGICLILGAFGIANMWLAIFADVGVMVIAVLNTIRALFVKKL